MKPKTIVSVLDSLSATKDVAFTKALGLAQSYESDLHVIHVGSSNRVGESAATEPDRAVEAGTLWR